MTTAPVVFVVDPDLSVRSSSNHSAIKICSMLFVSHWRKTVRDVRERRDSHYQSRDT